MKMMAELLPRLNFDLDNKFVWVTAPLSLYQKYNNPVELKSIIASNFASVVDGTDFGVVIVEEEKNFVTLSLWSRDNFNVSVIAQELGGGGHPEYAGAKVIGLNFEEAVEKVLAACKKYANKN